MRVTRGVDVKQEKMARYVAFSCRYALLYEIFTRRAVRCAVDTRYSLPAAPCQRYDMPQLPQLILRCRHTAVTCHGLCRQPLPLLPRDVMPYADTALRRCAYAT